MLRPSRVTGSPPQARIARGRSCGPSRPSPRVAHLRHEPSSQRSRVTFEPCWRLAGDPVRWRTTPETALAICRALEGGRQAQGPRNPVLVVQSRRRHWGRSSVTPSARAGRGGCALSVATGHRPCPSSLAPPLVVRHGSRMGPACRAPRRPRPVSGHAPCGAAPRTGHATAGTASRRGIVASRCIGCRRSPGHCTAMRALLTTGCRPAADFETCHQGA